MTGNLFIGIPLILVLVAANGFFVAAEFAVVAVRRSRLAELAEKGSSRARAAQRVVQQLDAYIAACQLGITMASLGLGWMGEPILASLFEPHLARLGVLAPATAHGIAVAVAFAVITTLHIVGGELAPKGLALQRPDGTSLWVARPLELFYRLFRWPITALNAIGNGALKLAGLEPATGHEMVHSVEELRMLVTGSQRAGVVEASEARIASRAFEFAELSAGALMTPRTEIEAVPLECSYDELLSRVAEASHTRLPVYEGSLDRVVGVLHIRDLFPISGGPPEHFDLRKLLRPMLKIPESKPADELLEEMRESRRHLALVLDEYGGTVGIVLLEDLLEGLVGSIHDELPSVWAEGEPGRPAEQADGSLLLDGLTRIRELEEVLGQSLDEEIQQGIDTLSGLVMSRLQRLPIEGDEILLGDKILRVESLRAHRVATARLIALKERDAEPASLA